MTTPESGLTSPRWLAAILVLLGVVLLGGSITIGVAMVQQVGQLSARVELTQGFVATNARTLYMTQRELLELRYQLATGEDWPELELQTQFVTQRTHESALSYQERTLGDRGLLKIARADERTWKQEVLPLVRRAGQPGPGAAAARQRAIVEVDRLEKSYNHLVSEGEKNRRARAGEAEESSNILLEHARNLVAGLIVTFLVAIAAYVVGGTLLVRVNRHRAATNHELSALNDDLQRYALIVQATDSMVVVTDTAGEITWVNDAFENTTGWRLDQVLGRRPGDFLQGPATDPAGVRHMAQSLAEGQRFRAELANYTADGREFWVAIDVSPLRDERGTLTGFVGVQSDVTERHQAELLLEQARAAAEESAREKSAFLATMSHEIRTPLNAVLGLTDLLMLTDLDDEQREYAVTAHRSGKHLLALVNDILDYSALESGRQESIEEDFSVVGLVEESVTMFVTDAENRGLELRLEVEGALPSLVTGDPTHLRQILVNVVGNAMKFTEQGSVLVRVAGPVEAPAGDTCPVSITVSDTGIGVPRWRIPSLFHSFARGDVSTTRKYGGTGLGLAISRRLVEGMGGRIDLESELGEGTTVRIDLTLRTAEELPAPTGESVTPAGLPDWSSLRVLVAEDDKVNQTVVLHMLQRFNVQATVVTNGRRAVDQVRTGEYDVVLLDIEMPVMDGLTAVRLIRQSDLDPAPWVVALTANALRGDRDRFLAAGMDDYVSKPVTLDALGGALERAAESRRAVPAQRVL